MIIDIECPFCNGAGRVHSSGRNGDPMDDGEDCPQVRRRAWFVADDCSFVKGA